MAIITAYKLLDKNFKSNDFTYNTPFDLKVMRNRIIQVEKISAETGISEFVDENQQFEEYVDDIRIPYEYVYIPSEQSADSGFVVYDKPFLCLNIVNKYARFAEVKAMNCVEMGDHYLAKKLVINRELSKDDFLNLCNGDCVDADGSHRWYLHGKLHRDGDPAVVEANGTQFWYQNGVLHRDDGPAIVRGNYRAWYENGCRINRR